MFKNNRINRIALVAAITVCSALTALAGNRITLGDGTPIAIKPGESKVIAVNLTNDEQIAGLQFDMEITSSNIEIVEGSLKVNETARDATNSPPRYITRQTANGATPSSPDPTPST